MSWALSEHRSRLLCGRYQLGEVIGAGGAARVFAATDLQLGRDVAIKVLDDAAARSADPAARDRFLVEARTAAGLNHQNLVRVHDAGEDDGALFLVMELVDGETLAERLATRGRLSTGEAVDIATQILDGLQAAHETGVVHRDVKPGNVLIDRAGNVRLTDFGIAKHLDAIEQSLTSDGMVVGTPTYFAPEQAVGGLLSPATDVYAVGIVLYEMLTGGRPVDRRRAATGWRARPLDPRRFRPGVPDRLAEVVVRATARDPEKRFASAAAMRAALIDEAPDRLSGSPAVDPLIAAVGEAPTTIVPHDAATETMPRSRIYSPAAVTAEVTSLRAPARRQRVWTWWLAGAVAAAVVLGLAVTAGHGGDDLFGVPFAPATSAPPESVPPETAPPETTPPESPPPTSVVTTAAPAAADTMPTEPTAGGGGAHNGDNGKKKGHKED